MTPVSDQEAYLYFGKSAQGGNSFAQYQFARILQYPVDSSYKQDLVESLKWFLIASKNEHEIAAEEADLMKIVMSREQVQEAIERANQFKPEKRNRYSRSFDDDKSYPSN